MVLVCWASIPTWHNSSGYIYITPGVSDTYSGGLQYRAMRTSGVFRPNPSVGLESSSGLYQGLRPSFFLNFISIDHIFLTFNFWTFRLNCVYRIFKSFNKEVPMCLYLNPWANCLEVGKVFRMNSVFRNFTLSRLGKFFSNIDGGDPLWFCP